jgi:hypothetical protein
VGQVQATPSRKQEFAPGSRHVVENRRGVPGIAQYLSRSKPSRPGTNDRNASHALT